MAGTAVTVLNEGLAVGDQKSEIEHLRLTVNKLVDDIELVRAALVAVATRLDGDAGVSGTTFVSADCAAINPATDLTAYKVNLLT